MIYNTNYQDLVFLAYQLKAKFKNQISIITNSNEIKGMFNLENFELLDFQIRYNGNEFLYLTVGNIYQNISLTEKEKIINILKNVIANIKYKEKQIGQPLAKYNITKANNYQSPCLIWGFTKENKETIIQDLLNSIIPQDLQILEKGYNNLKTQKLGYTPRKMLALYNEYLSELYNPLSKNIQEDGEKTIHLKMQSLIYLVDYLLNKRESLKFDLTNNLKSDVIANNLTDIDSKSKAVFDFYQEYNTNGDATLANLFSTNEIKTIDYSSYFLENILIKKDAIEIISTLLYIYLHFNTQDFESTYQILKEKTPNLANEELAQSLWKCLGLLKLVPIHITRTLKL